MTSVEGHPEMIIDCVRAVLKSECRCMDNEDVGGEDDDDSLEAEQDELLFEYAGDLMPALGMAMEPEKFAPYFAGFLPHVIKKTKKHCNVSERSFAAGSLAECLEPLGGHLHSFVPVLLPIFLNLVKDDEDTVRNNAVFGIGELALHGGPIVVEHYFNILEALSRLIGQEQSPRVIDQIIGAGECGTCSTKHYAVQHLACT